eukprot:13158076-Alexandrium_andersonii.AAC.1
MSDVRSSCFRRRSGQADARAAAPRRRLRNAPTAARAAARKGRGSQGPFAPIQLEIPEGRCRGTQKCHSRGPR